MNPVFLITFLALGASANSYYGQPQPQITVRVIEEPAPAARLTYTVPQIQRQPAHSYDVPQRQDSYSSGGGSRESQPIHTRIPILSFNQDIAGSNSNNVNFETANGIRSFMNTQVVPGKSEYIDENGRRAQSNTVLEQSGHSSHEAPEGGHISLTWRADSSGFHASGAHLPQPVEMPAEHAEAHRQALARVADSGSSESSYNSGSYSAPQQPVVRIQSYAAPQQPASINVQSYTTPAIRSGY